MMRKKNILRLLLALIAISAAVLVFSANQTSSKPGKEGLDSCSKTSKSSNLVWEDLTHRFFSSI